MSLRNINMCWVLAVVVINILVRARSSAAMHYDINSSFNWILNFLASMGMAKINIKIHTNDDADEDTLFIHRH